MPLERMDDPLAIQRIASKWEKTKVLRQNDQLLHYIPDTRKYSLEQLQDMLSTYDLVYIKPDHGTYGNGVMNAQKWSDEFPLEGEVPVQFKLRYGIQSELYATPEELHERILNKIGRKSYILQKGIHLLTYRRRSFDIRALVQITPRKNWETSGFIGRLAAEQKIVTNYHGGGTVLPIEELLGPHLKPKEFVKLYKEMKRLGVQTAVQLARKFPRLKEIGLDIAIDEQFHPWILEVNTLPALFPFKMLQDKQVYKKIRQYAVAYGRLKDKPAVNKR